MEINQSGTVTDSARSLARRDFFKAAGILGGGNVIIRRRPDKSASQ
jgi:hypothetical protein